MGTLLSNVGKVTGLEAAGLVAVLLIVAAGFYGVLQSYRQDLDRPSRVLSLLLAIPALVVISHVFPVIGIPGQSPQPPGVCSYILAAHAEELARPRRCRAVGAPLTGQQGASMDRPRCQSRRSPPPRLRKGT